MANLLFSLNDYIAYVFASHKKKLLVEGADDNRLFNRLIDVFDNQRALVDIDDASQLIEFGNGISNREKVEQVCSVIRKTSFANKLVGFVDREYRGFVLNPLIVDEICSHNIDGRLIWTRGHSIENYYFDYETLKIPISSLSTTKYYQEALRLFEKVFDQVISLACATSLVGLEIKNYQILRSAITWEVLMIKNETINVELSALETVLLERNVSELLVNIIIQRFEHYKNLILSADREIVRWMCHGHIGLTFIWAAFKRSVFEVSQANGILSPTNEVNHALETREEIRFNLCAARWIERSLRKECVFPYEVLQMLDLLQ